MLLELEKLQHPSERYQLAQRERDAPLYRPQMYLERGRCQRYHQLTQQTLLWT
jgi:hypothetical protein